MTTTAPGIRRGVAAAPPRRSLLRLTAFFAVTIALLAAVAIVHVTQGTSAVDAVEIVRMLLGGGAGDTSAIVVASRLPRLAAGLIVGVALGAAGAALQSVTRNALASPDTLAVNAGAHLAVVAVAALGIQLPFFGMSGVAFVGGLAAAALVLALSGAGGTSAVRLVLAGSAMALGLSSLTTTLILLFSNETRGLFAWGSGSLGQNGFDGIVGALPLIGLGVVGLLILCRRLDVLTLGDDHARTLGVPVVGTRVAAVVLAVLLAAAAVTLAGPIGFVGLAAPAVIRLLTSRIPGLARHAAFIPAAALSGAVLIIGADVLLRAVIGSQSAVEVPTGVITTIFGAILLVVLAQRVRNSSTVDEPPAAAARTSASRRRFTVFVIALVAAAAALTIASILLGDTKLLLGDLTNWVTGQAGPLVSTVLDTRLPRIGAALLAGACLGVSGAVIQAVTRNPLAEPGIIGVSGGAGLGAILVISFVPLTSFWGIAGGALAGAAVAAVIVFGLSARGGFASDRLVLVGVGVSAGTTALVSLVITLTDPWTETKALTWLSGSTYGRSPEHLIPMLAIALLVVPLLVSARRELDLLSLDDDTPRVLGIRVARSRLLLLSGAVGLAAAAVAGIGVIGFVGLIAPHAARSLVGRRHSRVLPTAALLGGILVCAADLLGRTVIAPAQLPAGLLTAVIGTPYFVWLLYRSGRLTRTR
ncbi:siderophore ABC transporter permease CdtC [Okibacterium endophyticum]